MSAVVLAWKECFFHFEILHFSNRSEFGDRLSSLILKYLAPISETAVISQADCISLSVQPVALWVDVIFFCLTVNPLFTWSQLVLGIVREIFGLIYSCGLADQTGINITAVVQEFHVVRSVVIIILSKHSWGGRRMKIEVK
jgi:hypothetical protein